MTASMAGSDDIGLDRDGAMALSADRKSTRLNSSHSQISYAVFCLKKKMEDRSLCNLPFSTVHHQHCDLDFITQIATDSEQDNVMLVSLVAGLVSVARYVVISTQR